MFKTDNLYQNDAQWKNALLGFSTSVTIGSWGCLLTSAAMVVNGLGYKETPLTMNTKMRGVGGFNGAAFFPAYVPAAFPGVVYAEYVDCEKTDAPLARIDAALAAGKPVIVCVDWNPQAGIQTHWVVLKDKKNNTYTMYDPYKYSGDTPTKELVLTERYKHQGTDPAKAILAAIFFDGQQVTPVEQPKPVEVPADTLTVYVIEDGLSLRAEPSVAAYRYMTLALNTALTSLEAKAAAQAKLGVSGQWLHIQEPGGKQGYVAAWYVAAAKKEAAQPAQPAQPVESGPDSTKFVSAAAKAPVPAGALTVYVTEDGLSFRSGPDLAAERLKGLALNTPLVSLEIGAITKSKLGVVGQWLHIQEPGGQQGYAAAWYLADKMTSPVDTPKTPAAGSSAPQSADVTAVSPTTANLVLRSAPVVNPETQIRMLSSQEVLTVLDPPAEAAARVGKQGEWLKVRDAQQKEGYVAAWYVRAVAPAQKPDAPAAVSAAVTAKTTGDQVAMRSQPVVADNTLVKRLPMGAVVTLIEPGDAARIGQQDQWIKVQDTEGAEGFIAAWYLAR